MLFNNLVCYSICFSYVFEIKLCFYKLYILVKSYDINEETI